MTQEEALQSDLVKTHGLESAFWIIANAHKTSAAVSKLRQERLTYQRGLFNSIMQQISTVLERANAPMELQAAVNSFGDTLEDEEVLAILQEWNSR